MMIAHDISNHLDYHNLEDCFLGAELEAISIRCNE